MAQRPVDWLQLNMQDFLTTHCESVSTKIKKWLMEYI